MRLLSRSPIDTRSMRRIRALRVFAGVARPAACVAAAIVVAARRNHCWFACSSWPNWWRMRSWSTGGSGTASMIDST